MVSARISPLVSRVPCSFDDMVSGHSSEVESLGLEVERLTAALTEANKRVAQLQLVRAAPAASTREEGVTAQTHRQRGRKPCLLVQTKQVVHLP